MVVWSEMPIICKGVVTVNDVHTAPTREKMEILIRYTRGHYKSQGL
jgi:hypothetical protein